MATAYREGLVADTEWRDFTRQQWIDAFEELDDDVIAGMRSRSDELNPLRLIVGSGARGSLGHLRQLSVAKGFVARPEPSTPGARGALDQPILESYREGLGPVDYFRSCHGTRKAAADHSIRTAKAGYLARRLVDVAHGLVITEEDCGTIRGVAVSSLLPEGSVVPLGERIRGSVIDDDVEHPVEKDASGRPLVVAEMGTLVDGELARKIEVTGVREVNVRSVLTCEAKRGVCRQCYGRNPATGALADIGDAVGIIAAQSLGEPATQQMLNAKHFGGAAAFVRRDTGVDPHIVTDVDGVVRFVDLVDGETLETSHDARTGRTMTTVRRPRRTDRDPRIEIVERSRWRDRVVRTFILPDGARLNAIDGSEVRASAVLATMPADALALADIANGLATLEALFEARVPANAATLSDITGEVRVGGLYKHEREVFVTAMRSNGEEDVRLHRVPAGARLVVHNGDFVQAGQRLSEGPINSHDVLRIRGMRAAQTHLVGAIQQVYRAHHIYVDDKHVALVVRQMLQQIVVVDSGETELIEGQHEDHFTYWWQNRLAKSAGKRPASAQPVLLGITKASLTTSSFISAASFQEATRVLADAAVRGARDDLLGLKENVIAGHLIPAGTGIHRRHEIHVQLAGVPKSETASQAPGGLSSRDDDDCQSASTSDTAALVE